MVNRFITATMLALISGGSVDSQIMAPKPKLVISIAIDQLRTDYIEAFLPYYSDNGFKKLFKEGILYTNAQYTFSPVDRASSIAALSTGASPSDNGITGMKWLDKSTLIPVNCVDDDQYEGIFTKDKSSPKNIATTTVGDELKVATDGMSLVYSIAKYRDAAILSGGHAADGVFWIDEDNRCWSSSKYYSKRVPNWVESYNLLYSKEFTEENTNANITNLALECINTSGIGIDDNPDLLSLVYEACVPSGTKDRYSRQQLQTVYVGLDRELERLTSKIESRFGKNNVLFVITSTGYCDEKDIDYSKFRIPGGTFYINRTANLLNMYLSAIYGQDKYVESCFYNQIFLNIKQIELKRISMSDILSRAQSFLVQSAGIRNVFTSSNFLQSGDGGNSRMRNWFNSDRCGDLIIEVTPGWKLLNEDNLQQYVSRGNIIPFPIIFYGGGIVCKVETSPVTTDCIAPTISKSIRIRAPNACMKPSLF